MNQHLQPRITQAIYALSDMQDGMEQLQKQLSELADHLVDLGDQAQTPTQESRFEQCLKVTLKHEGGWADDPNDPGGATMRGITLKTYQEWFMKNRWSGPSNVLPNAANLRKIPDSHLRTIYREGYWDVIQADKMSPGVDLVMFDFAVNSGPVRAVIELQRYLDTVLPYQVADDGVVGPRTLAALDMAVPRRAVFGVCGRRLLFCKKLKNWPHHGAGWTNRIMDIRGTALGMARLERDA